jgi:hypothetical protein
MSSSAYKESIIPCNDGPHREYNVVNVKGGRCLLIIAPYGKMSRQENRKF